MESSASEEMGSSNGSSNAATCNVCFARYNLAQRKPLVFTCGHTFCKECVFKMYTQMNVVRHQCPECRKALPYRSPNEVPINIAMQQLINLQI